MADAESPNTIFEMIVARLPAGHRIRVIYDNACNAQHYFLNREAELGEHVEFFVDELHYSGGHRNCCKGFDTGKCPLTFSFLGFSSFLFLKYSV